MEFAPEILGVDTNARRMLAPTIPFSWNPLAYPEKGKLSDNSYNYYSQDVVLSGLKKALNRGFSLEAVKWGLEQYYTNNYVRAWSWNVLLEYSLDAIGPADPTAFLRVHYLKVNYPNDVNAYITAVLILAQSEKANVILFANLMYPELKSAKTTAGLADDLGTPEQFQAFLDADLPNKNLSRIIPTIIALANIKKQPINKHYDTFLPIAMIHESFSRLQAGNQPSYLKTMLDAALENNWKWENRSIKIYLLLAHLYCTDNLPEKYFYQQMPADNVEYMAKLFISRDWHMFVIAANNGPYGASEYQIDMSTGGVKKTLENVEPWIGNISVLNPENQQWKQLTNFYITQFRNKKSKKIQ